MPNSTPRKTRLLAFDIEASNLNADFGIVLCVGFQEVGAKRVEVMSIGDYNESDPIKAERKLLKDVSARLLDADVWIAHFGRWYDTIFLNTRLLYHRLPLLPANFPLIDTWKVCKNQLKLRNNRLATLQDFLHLENEKNAIKPEQWIRAMAGHRPSLNYIVDHCRRDVAVLVEAYELVRPLITDHPHSGRECPICGSSKVQRRGEHVAKTRRYARFHCQNCGSWSKGEVTMKSPRLKL